VLTLMLGFLLLLILEWRAVAPPALKIEGATIRRRNFVHDTITLRVLAKHLSASADSFLDL